MNFLIKIHISNYEFRLLSLKLCLIWFLHWNIHNDLKLFFIVHKAVITEDYTVYGIRYTLYDLLSATDNFQVM